MALSQGKYNKPNFTPHQKTYVENRLKDERLRAKEEKKYFQRIKNSTKKKRQC